MGQITIAMDDNLEAKLRTHIDQRFGNRKVGKLSLVISEALEQYLDSGGAK